MKLDYGHIDSDLFLLLPAIGYQYGRRKALYAGWLFWELEVSWC